MAQKWHLTLPLFKPFLISLQSNTPPMTNRENHNFYNHNANISVYNRQRG